MGQGCTGRSCGNDLSVCRVLHEPLGTLQHHCLICVCNATHERSQQLAVAASQMPATWHDRGPARQPMHDCTLVPVTTHTCWIVRMHQPRPPHIVFIRSPHTPSTAAPSPAAAGCSPLAVCRCVVLLQAAITRGQPHAAGPWRAKHSVWPGPPQHSLDAVPQPAGRGAWPSQQVACARVGAVGWVGGAGRRSQTAPHRRQRADLLVVCHAARTRLMMSLCLPRAAARSLQPPNSGRD
jgi:hypothetical protein